MVNFQKSESIVSDKVIVNLLLCIAFSLFLLCMSARMMINHSSLNFSFNLLYIFFTMLTIFLLIFNESVDIGVALSSVAFIGVAIIIIVIGHYEFFFKFSVVFSTMFLPFMTNAVRLPELTFETFLRKFIKAANIFCCILLSIGIIDFLTGAGIQIFFAQHQIFEVDMARMALMEHAVGIYRYYSFFGDPLENAGYFLSFYVLNILYNRYFGTSLNEYIVTLITLVGIVLSGSRSALIISLFMFVFLNNRKHKVVFSFIMAMTSVGLVMTPVFQKNLMQRFFYGQTTGDFSEGRTEAFSRVIHGFVKPPVFFMGGGLGYSRQITLLMGGFINSFEYPVLMFPYDFGILGTIIIYMIILAIPVLIFIKNKSYFILMFFLALSFYFNGFNSIANYADDMGQFCFITMVLINMSYYINRRRVEGKETEFSERTLNS